MTRRELIGHFACFLAAWSVATLTVAGFVYFGDAR